MGDAFSAPLYPLLPHHIQDQRFNDFKNDTTKLSVDKAKLTSLCARDSANIQQVLIINLSWSPKNFRAFQGEKQSPGLSPCAIQYGNC